MVITVSLQSLQKQCASIVAGCQEILCGVLAPKYQIPCWGHFQHDQRECGGFLCRCSEMCTTHNLIVDGMIHFEAPERCDTMFSFLCGCWGVWLVVPRVEKEQSKLMRSTCHDVLPRGMQTQCTSDVCRQFVLFLQNSYIICGWHQHCKVTVIIIKELTTGSRATKYSARPASYLSIFWKCISHTIAIACGAHLHRSTYGFTTHLRCSVCRTLHHLSFTCLLLSNP